MKHQPKNQSKKQQGYPDLSVEAELLYPYVSTPGINFKEWSKGVINRFSLLRTDPQVKMRASPYGSLRLSIEFARHFAQMASAEFAGAVALRLIDEASQSEFRWMSDQPNGDLRRFQKLTLSRDWVDGLALHEFLQVESDFASWVSRLKDAQGMEYGRDYLRVIDTNQGTTEISIQDTGQGWLYLTAKFAMKVAMAESTPRGEAIGQSILAGRCRLGYDRGDYRGLP